MLTPKCTKFDLRGPTSKGRGREKGRGEGRKVERGRKGGGVAGGWMP